jgi:hypothetical protein
LCPPTSSVDFVAVASYCSIHAHRYCLALLDAHGFSYRCWHDDWNDGAASRAMMILTCAEGWRRPFGAANAH